MTASVDIRVIAATNRDLSEAIANGTFRADQLPDVRRSVEVEQARDLVLDLREVTLVDVEVVRFFLRCEQQGIRIAHCPAYVREWMAREKRPT